MVFFFIFSFFKFHRNKIIKDLCIEKLILVKDIDKIDPRTVIYPIDYDHFIAILGLY